MNIRPISVAPRAVAFRGQEITTTIKESLPEKEITELDALLQLNQEHISTLNLLGTFDSGVTLNFNSNSSNVARVTIPNYFDSCSTPITIYHPVQAIEGGIETKAFLVDYESLSKRGSEAVRKAKEVIIHLSGIAKDWQIARLKKDLGEVDLSILLR